MPWVFSVEPVPNQNPITGGYEPHGVKIVKTFYSDTGEIVVAIDTTVDEALTESSTDLSLEYKTEVAQSFKDQIDLLISMAASGELAMVSEGINLGRKISSALADIKKFNGPIEER